MVVELLTFMVPSDLVERWLRADAEVWTSFLEKQPGFVRKEVWQSDRELSRLAGDTNPIEACEGHQMYQAVIWWESLESWKAIDSQQVDSIDAGMGDLAIVPTMSSRRLVDLV